MAGQPGQGVGRTRKAAEKDAVALGKIEAFLDAIHENAVKCSECGTDINIKEIPAIAIKAAEIRYDKLRADLASMTAETIITHQHGSDGDIFGQIRRIVKEYPELRGPMLAAVMEGDPVDNQPEKPVDAQQQSTCSTDHNEAEQS